MMKVTVELTIEQIIEAFEEQEIPITEEKIKQLIDKLDIDKRGNVTNLSIIEELEESLSTALNLEISRIFGE